MQRYDVIGMSCAACSARVQKAVSKVPGVKECSVNLLTNSMNVEGTASEEQIIKAVQKAGYDANSCSKKNSNPTILSDTQTPKIKARLIASLSFLIVLMYFSMGPMFKIPMPKFFENNYVGLGIVQLLLCCVIMVINQRFFISGFKALFKRSPNMDSLVALGSSASFVYSFCSLLLMTKGSSSLHLYFESSAMILSFITIGKLLESRAKGKTTDAIKSLMKLTPQTAIVIKNGVEVEIEVEKLQIDDVFIVKPGASVPVDALVLDGFSSVDESMLSGESIPVEKTINSKVYAATINQHGLLKCKATKVGEDTVLSKIIEMVRNAQSTKAPIAKLSDKISGIFVPIVLLLALIVLITWLIVGKDFSFSLSRAISVLVISCPCALGLATPVAITVGTGIGAKKGILFKNAQALEQMAQIEVVAFDKTGTITQGRPMVTDVINADGVSINKLLTIAYSLESLSEHPLSKAVVDYAIDNRITRQEVKDFSIVVGNGLKGKIDNKEALGGSLTFINNFAILNEDIKKEAQRLASEGKTPLFFALEGELLGLIGVSDVIKEDSKKAIKELVDMGINVVMLTGDNQNTAASIAKSVGIKDFVSSILPDQKQSIINQLKTNAKVAMVGDGINDAPALTSADIGVAIGAGTDVALGASDVVLVKNKLKDVVLAIKLSRASMRVIKQNLFWAFFYNALGIPLAAGAFGLSLNPAIGALAMSLSSFCVVSNALRLNFLNLDKLKVQRKPKELNIELRRPTVKKIMKIEGMMCTHCEARVKKTLLAIEGVSEAVVNFHEGTAIITLDSQVSQDLLKAKVEEQDYKVLSIE